MSQCHTLFRLGKKAGVLLGTLLLLGVFLSALPGHHTPNVLNAAPQAASSSGNTTGMEQAKMPGVEVNHERARERSIVGVMWPDHPNGRSGNLTRTRPPSAQIVRAHHTP